MALAGRSILVVEDEPLIALDLAEHFEGAGAKVLSAAKAADALELAERPGLRAAVLDYALADGDCRPIAVRLQLRQVPFLIYTGYNHVREMWPDVPVIPKPADPQDLIDLLARLAAPRRMSA
jgi:DNA-binding response OmpR family regulator